ncbi:MAG TPA: calcium/sodium antiporter [Ruminococcus sp.]|nr:calcium/sodium antiporter [Ruminococcus sp.]
MMYFLLITGFVLLIKGADFFVDGSSAVAKKFKVSPLIIGMTIVAMGTSLPETSVSVSASLAGKNDLSISNVVGSNIFNLMIVAGVCAVFNRLPVSGIALKRDFPVSVAAALVLIGFGGLLGEVPRYGGLILLLLFAGFLWLMIHSALKAREEADEEYKDIANWKCALFILGGIAAIAAGGKMVVEGVSDIARNFGMSDNLIGMTIVALGTSLPELVTSIVAARKKETDMALGNVIGSNIFNILFVLGIAATISPMGFTLENTIDTAFLIAVSLMVMTFCIPKKQLERWHGIAMILLYSGYTAYLFVR